jgi:hypothetical protein
MTAIHYILKHNERTREPLRDIIELNLLKDQAILIWNTLCDNQDYRDVWTTPSKLMPRKTIIPGEKYTLQSPEEYIRGFIEKITRRTGNDLSQKQCEGFEIFSFWFSREFGIEHLVFREYNKDIDSAVEQLF